MGGGEGGGATVNHNVSVQVKARFYHKHQTTSKLENQIRIHPNSITVCVCGVKLLENETKSCRLFPNVLLSPERSVFTLPISPVTQTSTSVELPAAVLLFDLQGARYKLPAHWLAPVWSRVLETSGGVKTPRRLSHEVSRQERAARHRRGDLTCSPRPSPLFPGLSLLS